MIDARDARKDDVYRAGKHFAVQQGTLPCRIDRSRYFDTRCRPVRENGTALKSGVKKRWGTIESGCPISPYAVAGGKSVRQLRAPGNLPQ